MAVILVGTSDVSAPHVYVSSCLAKIAHGHTHTYKQDGCQGCIVSFCKVYRWSKLLFSEGISNRYQNTKQKRFSKIDFQANVLDFYLKFCFFSVLSVRASRLLCLCLSAQLSIYSSFSPSGNGIEWESLSVSLLQLASHGNPAPYPRSFNVWVLTRCL